MAYFFEAITSPVLYWEIRVSELGDHSEVTASYQLYYCMHMIYNVVERFSVCKFAKFLVDTYML